MSLFDVTSKIVGRKYELGKCDCFKVIADYVGIPSTETYQGLSFENYADEFLKDPTVIEKAVQYLSERLTEIPHQLSVAGDILYMQYEDRTPSFAIDAGNGKAVIVSEQRGVHTISKSHYKILRAYQCHKQSQRR